MPVLKWPEMSLMESMYVFPEKPDAEKNPEAHERMMKFATRKRHIIRDNKDSTQPIKFNLLFEPSSACVSVLTALGLTLF